MSDNMGTFRIDVELENPATPGRRERVTSVLIDTGVELSWFPTPILEALGIERFKRSRFRLPPPWRTLDPGRLLLVSAPRASHLCAVDVLRPRRPGACHVE
jgi:hypothetical protein